MVISRNNLNPTAIKTTIFYDEMKNIPFPIMSGKENPVEERFG